MLGMLQKFHWTTDKFMGVIADHRKDYRVRKAYKQYKRFAYGTALRRDDDAVDKDDWKEVLDVGGIYQAAESLRTEVKGLVQTKCFGQFSMDEATGSLTTLGEFEDTVQAKAPVWNRVLHRASHTDKKFDGEIAYKKHTLILSILCNNMHRKLSDNLPTLLSIYMASGGCRGRVIDLFNSLGLCKSSKPTHAIMKKPSEQGRDKVREAGSNPMAIVTYDNFEFTDGRRGDRIGDKRSFRSITTCITLVGQGMPECGLNACGSL
ncbi:MAG: hypothetical protein MMC33_010559 [Icmadophila ericetorum]|nr:hypothetical protein [Icmadophila ericetorum]